MILKKGDKIKVEIETVVDYIEASGTMKDPVILVWIKGCNALGFPLDMVRKVEE
jgi:hypothetical protein